MNSESHSADPFNRADVSLKTPKILLCFVGRKRLLDRRLPSKFQSSSKHEESRSLLQLASSLSSPAFLWYGTLNIQNINSAVFTAKFKLSANQLWAIGAISYPPCFTRSRRCIHGDVRQLTTLAKKIVTAEKFMRLTDGSIM